MLAELTVLMLAELNDFPGSDIIAKRNDLQILTSLSTGPISMR